MNDAKYIGLDVHQATISVAVLDGTGHLLMESIVETKAATILQFVHGLRGSVQVTFEEGTCAAWLHDLLKPHVTSVLVCDPRKNALLKAGNKNDRIDARKLADLLRQPQPRSEKYLQGGCDPGRCRTGTVPAVLRRFSSHRNEADDGAPHPGAQDRGHHFDRLEERSRFRRPTSETTSSLSVCGESVAGFISGDGRLVLQTLWFEGEYPESR